MIGKRGTAPCGHEGEHLTANYVRCDAGCDSSDGVPTHVEPERTQPICPHFGCPGGVIVVWPAEWRHNGLDYYLCRGCGRSFYACV